jgi:hypothetical protein
VQAGAQFSATQRALRAIANSLRDKVYSDAVTIMGVFLEATAAPGQTALYEKSSQPYDPSRLQQKGIIFAIAEEPQK